MRKYFPPPLKILIFLNVLAAHYLKINKNFNFFKKTLDIWHFIVLKCLKI